MSNVSPKMNRLGSRGFTLIELIAVIVIGGILAAVAIQKVGVVGDKLKVEETMREMERLGFAIVGNPDLNRNGVRSDFGYVGDVGSLPPNLDALVTNPGGLATWRGPYITNSFEQMTGDYKKDAWLTDYSYSGGIDIISVGSGENIMRRMATNARAVLYNRLDGLARDRDGTPPGNVFKDSILVQLTHPNGLGGNIVKTAAVDIGGYFRFDSIPIGHQTLEVIYQPDDDSITRYVAIGPNSSPYVECYFSNNVWTASGSGVPTGSIEYVPGSAQTQTGNCDRLEFDVTNTSGSNINITSLSASWSSPIAYYKKLKWGGSTVFDSQNPSAASGQSVNFSSSQSIGAGSTVTIQLDKFNSIITGDGSKVGMGNVDMTITLSDGSVVIFNTGACN